MEIKTPAHLRHCRDSSEVKSWHLSPAMSPLSAAPYDWCIIPLVSCRLVGMVAPRSQVTCWLLYKSTLLMAFGLTLEMDEWSWLQKFHQRSLAYTRKLGNRRSSEGLRSFKPSNGTNLITLLILAGDIEMNPGPRFQFVECEDCEKCFHASSAKLGDNELLKLKSGNGSWYCTNCKADCGLCSGAVLKDHKAVQCHNCEMWVYNECPFITESQYETLENTNCTWICPKCDFSTFPIFSLMSS